MLTRLCTTHWGRKLNLFAIRVLCQTPYCFKTLTGPKKTEELKHKNYTVGLANSVPCPLKFCIYDDGLLQFHRCIGFCLAASMNFQHAFFFLQELNMSPSKGLVCWGAEVTYGPNYLSVFVVVWMMSMLVFNWNGRSQLLFSLVPAAVFCF